MVNDELIVPEITACRVSVWDQIDSELNDIASNLAGWDSDYAGQYETYVSARDAYLLAESTHRRLAWELDGMHRRGDFVSELKARIEQENNLYEEILAATGAAGSATTAQIVEMREHKQAVAHMQEILVVLQEDSTVQARIDQLRTSVPAAKSDMDSAYASFDDARNTAYDTKSRIFRRGTEADFNTLKNEMVAKIQAKLDAAIAVRDTEQARCDANTSEANATSQELQDKQDARDALDDQIDDLENSCDSSIFRSERIESWEAQQSALYDAITLWEDGNQTGLKIDDIVHTWDEIYDSQTQKCSDAQDAVDLYTDELDAYSYWTYLGMPVYDEEEMVHTCVDDDWGHLGIYTVDEWDSSDYCLPPDQTTFDALVTAIMLDPSSDTAQTAFNTGLAATNCGPCTFPANYDDQTGSLEERLAAITVTYNAELPDYNAWVAELAPLDLAPLQATIDALVVERDAIDAQYTATRNVNKSKADENLACDDNQATWEAEIQSNNDAIDALWEELHGLRSERTGYWRWLSEQETARAGDLELELSLAKQRIYQGAQSNVFDVDSTVSGTSSGGHVTKGGETMLRCMQSGDYPVGIEVCTDPIIDATNVGILSITGLRVYYGQEGPRCDFVETTDKSVFSPGPIHGDMGGTCDTKWFNGWSVEEIVFYSGAVNVEGIEIHTNDDAETTPFTMGTTTGSTNSWSWTVSEDLSRRRLSTSDAFFGFDTSSPNGANRIESVQVVSYDPEELNTTRDAYENNLTRIAEAQHNAQNYAERAYLDDEWLWIEAILASNQVASTSKASATDTDVYRPETAAATEAEYDSIKAAQAATHDPHSADDDLAGHDDNEDVLIATIIGAVVLFIMMLVSFMGRMRRMMMMSNTPM